VIERIAPEWERMTSEWVVAPPGLLPTPTIRAPSVTPVAAKK
jgi:hypothetical protein